MYVKIHKPADYFGNRGSSGQLITYLEKENPGKEAVEQEQFFDHYQDQVPAHKAELILDTNHKGLSADESKFYMLTLNPSEKELEFLKTRLEGTDSPASNELLKEYTRAVMDEYAESFNRKIDGRPLEGADLVYFAKIENGRTYKPQEIQYKESYSHNQGIRKEITKLKKELKQPDITGRSKAGVEKKTSVLEGQYQRDKGGVVILPGNAKKGLNTHVHVVVSRRDKQQRLKLSPLANSRGSQNRLNGKNVQTGFNRSEFVDKAERIFDRKFAYDRALQESYQYHHAKVHDAGKYLKALINQPTDPRLVAKRLVRQMVDRPEVQKILNAPTSARQLRNRIISKAVDNVASVITPGAHPAGVPATIIKKGIIKAVDAVVKAAELGF